MATFPAFLFVALVACIVSLATFLVFYYVWLRTILRRLVEVQALLRKVSNNLRGAEDSFSSRPNETRTEKVLAPPRLQMSIEGKSLAILEINGHDVVRFQDNLSEQQKKRIIEYLKVEGFISPTRHT